VKIKEERQDARKPIVWTPKNSAVYLQLGMADSAQQRDSVSVFEIARQFVNDDEKKRKSSI